MPEPFVITVSHRVKTEKPGTYASVTPLLKGWPPLKLKKAHPHKCEVELTVPFHDLDPMQVVWHGHYLKYFEIARTALFSNYGIDLYTYFQKTNILFPIVKTFTKHVMPLRHNDRFVCEASLEEIQYKITVDFQIRLQKNDHICTRGRSEQVAVKYPGMEMMLQIPDDIRQIVESA